MTLDELFNYTAPRPTITWGAILNITSGPYKALYPVTLTYNFTSTGGGGPFGLPPVHHETLTGIWVRTLSRLSNESVKLVLFRTTTFGAVVAGHQTEELSFSAQVEHATNAAYHPPSLTPIASFAFDGNQTTSGPCSPGAVYVFSPESPTRLINCCIAG